MKTYFDVYKSSDGFLVIEEKESKPSCSAKHALTEIFQFVKNAQKTSHEEFKIKRLNGEVREYHHLYKQTAQELEDITGQIASDYIKTYESRRSRIGKIWDKIIKFLGYRTEKRKVDDLRYTIYSELKPAHSHSVPDGAPNPHQEFFDWLNQQPPPKPGKSHPTYDDWLKTIKPRH